MAPKNRTNNRDIRSISSLTTDQKQELDNLSHIDIGSKDRFYKPHEYRHLSRDQKRKLWLLRQHRGGNNNSNGGGKGRRNGGSWKKKFQDTNDELRDAKRKIAALESRDDNELISERSDPIENSGGEKGRVRFNQRS